MKFNGLYDTIKAFLQRENFLNDYVIQDSVLSSFRAAIKNAVMPQWMLDELMEMQQLYPESASIRCRSSTNNEDLPGFSGAGLYGSKTQHPYEGHIKKSIQQVYASLWNYRAFAERDFYRIDHLYTAMGVLVHYNYSGEKANGVAVTTDPRYETKNTFYLNTQLGEDLVTNPLSIPEEILLLSTSGNFFSVVQQSNLVDYGIKILSDNHLEKLQKHLKTIHDEFKELYKARDDSSFAMEIEYKITADDKLAIKQARPWLGKRLLIASQKRMKQTTPQKRCLLLASCRGGFRTGVDLTVTLHKKQPVMVIVFNCLGRQIAKVNPGYLSAGSHLLRWNAPISSYGVYFIKVTTPDAWQILRANQIDGRP